MLALSALLMACTPAENANTETAAATEAAEAQPNAGGMTAAPVAGPQTPYTPSEQQMHQAMMLTISSHLTYSLSASIYGNV